MTKDLLKELLQEAKWIMHVGHIMNFYVILLKKEQASDSCTNHIIQVGLVHCRISEL